MNKILVASLLLFFMGVFSGFLFHQRGNFLQEIQQLTKENDFYRNARKASNELRLLEFKNQAVNISDNIIVKSIEGNSNTITELSGKEKILLFCIPEGVCNTCHENTLTLINDIVKIIGYDNIVIVVDVSKLRPTVAEFKSKGISINIRGIDFEKMKIDIHYVPFMFIASKESTCENLFVTNSFNIKLTMDYVKTIKERYFNN